jgi:hypothetical protein
MKLNPVVMRLFVLLEIGIAYFVVNIIFNKEDTLINFKYELSALKKGRRIFVIYLVGLVSLFFLIVFTQWHINQ